MYIFPNLNQGERRNFNLIVIEIEFILAERLSVNISADVELRAERT